MVKIPNIVPITDLRQDAKAIVMVSVEDYEHSRNELELMRLLARGQKEIEAGAGYDLDAVLAEADILLEDLQA